MLLWRLLVNISSIWEVVGVLLGVLGGRFVFDLGSKIYMSNGIIEIQESMLSPAWEHDFSMVWGWFFTDFHGLALYLEVSEVTWKGLESLGGFWEGLETPISQNLEDVSGRLLDSGGPGS